MTSSPLPNAAALLVAASAVVLPLAATAGASSTPGTPGAGIVRHRLEVACARVPPLTERTQKLIDRLQADASTRGSLAWLEAKLDTARTHDKPQLATVLENRLTTRKAKLTLLQDRLTTLSSIETFCAEHGL